MQEKQFYVFLQSTEKNLSTYMLYESEINSDFGFRAQECCDILSLDIGQSILFNISGKELIVTRIFDIKHLKN